MKAFESFVHTSFAGALGWTLFHSLWQGAIAAAALALVLSIARSPRIRYACAALAMIAILAGVVVTLIWMIPEPSRPFATPIVLPAAAPLAGGISTAASGRLKMSEIVPWLTPLWIAGVIVFYLRAVASWASARRLRRTGVCLAPEAWQCRLSALADRLLGVTASVSLLESSIAAAPVVIGFLRPVILTPVGMLAGMPASQIECILLHELAHIRRADYLANLLQTAAESLLFYNPAIWWISHVIRVERENCCDDLVVSADGDAHDYATALSALAENRLTTAALPANGGALVNRIRRLLYPETASPSFLMPLFSAGLVVLVTAVAATAWQSAPPAARQIAQAQSTRPALPPAAAPAVPELETPWRKWLNEDVTYIITDAERDAFGRLQTDDEREE
ncbi:MAG TPA: M56 family metallopeptidase, partial [Bryobacteraceae bacterium]